MEKEHNDDFRWTVGPEVETTEKNPEFKSTVASLN
jgi:hypothetical protein